MLKSYQKRLTESSILLPLADPYLLNPVKSHPYEKTGEGRTLSRRFFALPNFFVCHRSEKLVAKRASDEDASPERAQRVEGPQSIAKSCVCHRSAKSPPKSFPCHTSKNALPQVLCLPHIQDPPPGVCISRPCRRSRVCPAKQTGGFLTLANPCSVPHDQIHQGLLPLVGRPPAHPEIPSPANPVIIRFPGLRDCC